MSDPLPSWATYTNEQIRSRVKAEYRELTGFPEGKSSTFRAVVPEFVALTEQHVYDTAIRPIIDAIDPRAAASAYLRLHGVLAGAAAREARATQGHATVTSATGGRVRTGERIEAGGAGFIVDADAQLTAGVDRPVAITAELVGVGGNVAAGTEAAFASPPPRAADATVRLDADWITRYGHDADDPEDAPEAYRQRVLAGLEIRGEARTDARYRAAALGVPGCTAARTVRTPRGLESVDLLVLFDGMQPTDAQLALVRAAMREAQLVGADVVVRGPTVVTVAVDAVVTGTALPADVADAIRAWWWANVGIGSNVLLRDLYAIAVPGMTSIDYRSPLRSLDGSRGQWFSPTITVTAA